MSNRGKLLSVIATIMTVIIVVVIIIEKILYYADRLYFGSDISKRMEGVLWAFISILISLLPMIMLTITNLFILISKTRKLIAIPILTFCLCCGLLVANIVFEIISLFAGGMCLDGEMVDMALKMVPYHLVSVIPIIVTLVALIRMGLRRENSIK